ncbi:MAG TPA: hypothetical protein VKB09_12765, partial [Thermomicrobiales bacterium]|nr:hypothetical protein [Thermomicrobiales bacterium]
MSEWQPDWTTLNATASSFIESTPLSARIKTVTPVGGHVAIGLQMDLAQILTDAGASDHPLTGDLVIAVDTLTIPAGDTAIAAPTMEIVARALQVADGGNATLHLRSDSPAGLQVTTASIAGSIGVRLEASDGTPIGDGAGPTLQLSGLKTPQVLTVTGDAPTSVSTSTATDDVADTLHAPWSILALQLSSAIASVLVDEQTDEAMSLAADMLRWVTGGCYALIAERAAYTTVDYDEITSLQNASIGLLALTQASASGATYVPVLAADVYQTEVNALLGVAWTYDQKISDLADQSKVEQLLANLAQTLKSINQSAETPLFNTLRRLNDDSASVENQLTNAAVQLQQVGATLEPLQEALVDAINDEFQKKLLESALETFFTVLNLYVGAAAVILGDPEILAGSADKMIKAAIDIAKEVIEAGEKGIDAAISAGASPAGDPPIDADAQRAMDGAQYLAGSIASFGSAVSSLWAVVSAATAGGQGKINVTPDLLSTVEKLP